ncbi:riboflavin kinase, partial [Streptococcus agalactiae]|uniref:riboflavin kinase n=1 Tax=Streptococcus agalactiae TaxID=1311 RepID=UPI0034DE6717
MESFEGRRWSSTWVRQALAAGDVTLANRILGRNYRLRGRVEHGFKRGRQLGFPTANLNSRGVGFV